MNYKPLLQIALLAASSVAHADWSYSEDVDKMDSKVTKYAQMLSANSLSLPFPYAGTNRGGLMVRQRPQRGPDVIVHVDKGQILCNSFEGCTVTVRFDDAPPMKFSGTGPSDHSTTAVFLNSESKFINAARKAKRILVQLSMYQAGSQILEFETAEPLKWDPAARAPRTSR